MQHGQLNIDSLHNLLVIYCKTIECLDGCQVTDSHDLEHYPSYSVCSHVKEVHSQKKQLTTLYIIISVLCLSQLPVIIQSTHSIEYMHIDRRLTEMMMYSGICTGCRYEFRGHESARSFLTGSG